MVLSYAQVFAGAAVRSSGPGRFGTPSYFQPGTDCPPSGSWENYCDCMFENTGSKSSSDENHLCRSHWCAVFNPWNAGDCSADIRKASPPWTEVGAAARGIRKPNAGLVYSATSLTNMPSPESFTPLNIFFTSYTDIPMVAKMFLVSKIPAFLYLAPLMELYGHPGLNLTQLPILVPMAYAIGGWDYVGEKIIAPVMEFGGNAADAVISWFMGGSVGAIAAVARQLSRKLKKSGQNEAAALVGLIGENSLQIFDLVQNPQKLKYEDGSAWGSLGNVIRSVGEQMPDQFQALKTLLLDIGIGMGTFKWSLAALARGDGEEAGNQLTRSERLLGMSYRDFMAAVKEQAVSWKQVSKNLSASNLSSFFSSPSLSDLGNRIAGVFNRLARGFSELNPGGAFNDLIKSLKSFAANVGRLGEIASDVKKQAAAQGVTLTDAGATMPGTGTTGIVPATTTNPAQAQVQNLAASGAILSAVLSQSAAAPAPDWGKVVAAKAPPSPARRALVGAGVGALFGGPPGALLGAGAFALSALVKGK